MPYSDDCLEIGRIPGTLQPRPSKKTAIAKTTRFKNQSQCQTPRQPRQKLTNGFSTLLTLHSSHAPSATPTGDPPNGATRTSSRSCLKTPEEKQPPCKLHRRILVRQRLSPRLHRLRMAPRRPSKERQQQQEEDRTSRRQLRTYPHLSWRIMRGRCSHPGQQ